MTNSLSLSPNPDMVKRGHKTKQRVLTCISYSSAQLSLSAIGEKPTRTGVCQGCFEVEKYYAYVCIREVGGRQLLFANSRLLGEARRGQCGDKVVVASRSSRRKKRLS
ncbi:hypothetical protein ABZP36_006723 [Zizania latifolia]